MVEHVEHASTVDESQHEPTDDVVSLAILRVLQLVVGVHSRANSRGTIVDRLHSSGAKLFRGVLG